MHSLINDINYLWNFLFVNIPSLLSLVQNFHQLHTINQLITHLFNIHILAQFVHMCNIHF